MKNLIFIVCVTLTWNAVVGSNNTEDGSQNKTKRGIIDQTHYYGEPVTIKYISTPIIHHDSNAAPATNFNFNNPKPIVFHNSNAQNSPNEPPKQVTVEQVVYEYQQTPHNAVSNVHVNQQFQTSPTATVVNVQKQYLPDTIHSPSQNQLNPYLGNQAHIIQQEPTQYSGVAAPVHHGAVIHHGQGYSKVLYDPYTVTTSAPIQQHNVNPQAKYVYANGKITYHPLSVNSPYPGVVLNARPHNLVVNQNYRPTQKPFKPSPVIPITYNRPIQHKQQPIRTTEAPRKEEIEEEDEDEEKSNVREEQDEDEAEPEDTARYEEESEEEDEGFKPSAYFSKYRYEDEDEDHDRYREDKEDEEDEERSSSSAREVRKKPKKNNSKSSARQQKNDHFKSREGFKTKKHAEYTAPSEYSKFESSGRKPKSEFKSYKYYKSSNNSKPKKEVIESRESEHIPVVHNKKIVHSEKWLVTKNTSE